MTQQQATRNLTAALSALPVGATLHQRCCGELMQAYARVVAPGVIRTALAYDSLRDHPVARVAHAWVDARMANNGWEAPASAEDAARLPEVVLPA